MSERDADVGIERVKQIRNKALVRERRSQILDAALGLFSEKGYDRTTIRDICERSGVNQASLYDYVRNKQDILRRLLHRMHRPENAAGAVDFESDDAIAELFGYAWGHNRRAILLTYQVARDLARDDLHDLLGRDAALIRRVEGHLRRRTGLAADDPRVAVIANLIVFLNAFAPFRDWYMKDLDRDFVLQTVVDAVDAMVRALGDNATR